MGFRGQPFAFDSPADAIAGFIDRLRLDPHNPKLEHVPLEHARGRVLAQSVCADRDNPAQDYAAMDGYAIRVTDCRVGPGQASPIHLKVTDECRIGQPPPVMPAKPAAIRIVTGAGMPLGSDVVVRREDVVEHERSRESTSAGEISIPLNALSRLRAGDNIRRRGENAQAGREVLAKGTLLTASAMGALATVGQTRPCVYLKLRVALITTGDELVNPQTVPNTFQVRNCNAPAISSLLGAHSWLEVGSTRHLGDDDRLDLTLRDALANADAVVLTGGVSMGHRDRVREAIEAVGAVMVFHGLPQRPGKPMLGAVAPPAQALGPPTPVFGLPGNPISAMVTCLRVVVPVLAALAGITRPPAPPRVALAAPTDDAIDMWWHRLVTLNAAGQAVLVDGRGSGDMIAGGYSDGFIEVPPLGRAHTGESAHGLYPFYAWPL